MSVRKTIGLVRSTWSKRSNTSSVVNTEQLKGEMLSQIIDEGVAESNYARVRVKLESICSWVDYSTKGQCREWSDERWESRVKETEWRKAVFRTIRQVDSELQVLIADTGLVPSVVKRKRNVRSPAWGRGRRCPRCAGGRRRERSPTGRSCTAPIESNRMNMWSSVYVYNSRDAR